MRLNNKIVAAITIAVVFGGIFVADRLGVWQTTSSKVPKTFQSGEFIGMPMPEDIRGSYSFDDIENAFEIEAPILAEAFNLQADDPGSILLKDLESVYADMDGGVELGTGSVRKFVALYTGLPYEGEDYLPSTAVSVLKDSDKWNEAMERALQDFIVAVDTVVPLETAEKNTDSESEEDHEEEIAVKGKTTVADAVSYGIPLEEIEEILNVKIENENMLIRDICEQNSLSFPTVKDQLNDILE